LLGPGKKGKQSGAEGDTMSGNRYPHLENRSVHRQQEQERRVQMSIHIIPVNRLSPGALQGVIEEFILRDGTDYGEREASPEANFRQVRDKLEKGLAVLIFDDETETTNIFLADNPILKKIREPGD
jgi:uncharacterized protein YheU (UPF0270 family)